MLIRRIFLLMLCVGALSHAVDSRAQDAPAAITASDLAQFLHVHWWFLKLSDSAQPGSSVAVQWVASDGIGLTGCSATMTNTSLKAGAVVKIYFRDEVSGPAVTIQSPEGGLDTTFPAVSTVGASLGGLPNGAFAKSGDVLLKVIHRKQDGSLNLAQGNTIDPGDVGMRIVIRPPAKQ